MALCPPLCTIWWLTCLASRPEVRQRTTRLQTDTNHCN